MAVNGVAKRTGKVWRDRYHRQDLCSPRQVRNAFVYVLFNVRKHAASDRELRVWNECLDPCSSAASFTGWAPRAGPTPAQLARAGPAIVAPPRSWLANRGWRRAGLIRMDETVRSSS